MKTRNKTFITKKLLLKFAIVTILFQNTSIANANNNILNETETKNTETKHEKIQNINDVSDQDKKIGIYTEVIKQGAFSLNSENNFRPNEIINKAAFFKAAMVYSGYKPSKLNNFTGYLDVPEDSWFAPYVKKALESQIIQNFINDKFYPEQNLTRQEALLLAMRIYGIPTPPITPKPEYLYNDIRINHPLAAIYAAAKKYGIYFENSKENFRPNVILTRGDAAELLFKTKFAANIILNNDATSSQSSRTEDFYLSDIEKEFLQNEKFSILLDTWRKIHNEYINKQNINSNKLIYGAINGMVNSLNDPYSNFSEPEDETSLLYIPNNYEGIGVLIEQFEEQYVIMTVIQNAPAHRAGVESGDILLEIDGKITKNMTYEQVIESMQGKAGNAIKLKVQRNKEILNFEIIREIITINSIEYKILDNQINYIRINQFTEEINTEFKEYLEKILNSGSKKLIIDLRNNPGGYLSSTTEILGYFLDKDKVGFMTIDSEKNEKKYSPQNGESELKDFHTVVLVNENSASASEIFAAALQDHKLAKIIGNTTFGKGTVQEITAYNDNSSLKLTIAKWLTPSGIDIDKKGVIPDQIVTISKEQKQSGKDPQLEEAIKYLNFK